MIMQLKPARKQSQGKLFLLMSLLEPFEANPHLAKATRKSQSQQWQNQKNTVKVHNEMKWMQKAMAVGPPES